MEPQAHALNTGFTSGRKCHLCESQEPRLDIYNRFKGSADEIIPAKDWWDMRPTAVWRSAAGRPGPSPFKQMGGVFAHVPGGGVPARIKPDLVHTFHIGIGADLSSSILVWLVTLGKIGGRRKFNENLLEAFSLFKRWCHDTHRYTSCDTWTNKKIGKKSLLGFTASC